MRQRQGYGNHTLLLLLVVLITILASAQNGECKEQTIQRKPLQKLLVVPHSHWDVGWLETAEQYYNYAVKNIISGVVKALMSDPSRRFLFAEMSFISRWWQDPEVLTSERDNFKLLLKNKQIEIVLGAWTMPDEATTTYVSIMESITRGHRWIAQTFGKEFLPSSSWRIDPFGLSPIITKLYYEGGMNRSVIFRIPDDMRQEFQQKLDMDFMWTYNAPMDDARGKRSTQVLTSILNNQYCIYNVFNTWFEQTNSFNYQERLSFFFTESLQRYKGFKSGRLLLPYGCDFSFTSNSDAELRFQIMQKLLPEFKKNYNWTASFATLKDYFNEIEEGRKEGGIMKLSEFSGTFVPYADGPDAWWTGFFTSYGYMKQLTREAEHLYRSLNMLYSTSLPYLYSFPKFNRYYSKIALDALETLQTTIADVTHHDAITGTSKRAVMQSYLEQINSATRKAKTVIALALHILSGKVTEADLLDITLSEDPVLNTQVDMVSDSNSIEKLRELKTMWTVMLYNSLAWDRQDTVLIPVKIPSIANEFDIEKLAKQVQVFDGTRGTPVTAQFIIQPAVHTLEKTLYLVVSSNAPALGFSTLLIVKNSQEAESSVHFKASSASSSIEKSGTFTISNEMFDLQFCKEYKGYMCSLFSKKKRLSLLLNQEIKYYPSWNFEGRQPSGAYIFRPMVNEPRKNSTLPLNKEVVASKITRGPLVTVIEQDITTYMKQLIYVYSNEEYIDVRFTVTTKLPDDYEAVTIFNTNIKDSISSSNGGGSFYTDMNGFNMQKKQFKAKRRIAGNYAPMVSSAFIEDSVLKFSVHSARTHGVTSFTSTETSSSGSAALEIMLHRKTSKDDERGVAEMLLDPYTVDSTFRLSVDHGSSGQSAADQTCIQTRHEMFELNNPVLVQVKSTVTTLAKSEYMEGNKKIATSILGRSRFVPLKKPFPDAIHLLSFDTYKHLTQESSTSTYIRLQHIGGAECEESMHTVSLLLHAHFFADHVISNVSAVSFNTLFNITSVIQQVEKQSLFYSLFSKSSSAAAESLEYKLFPEDLITLHVDFEPASVKQQLTITNLSSGYLSATIIIVAVMVMCVALVLTIVFLFKMEHISLFQELAHVFKGFEERDEQERRRGGNQDEEEEEFGGHLSRPNENETL